MQKIETRYFPAGRTYPEAYVVDIVYGPGSWKREHYPTEAAQRARVIDLRARILEAKRAA